MAHTLPPDLFFDLVSSDEVLAVHRLELSGYPPEEAATLDKFYQRQKQAPELFLGAFLPHSPDHSVESSHQRTLIGYVCSTLSAARTLTHDSMSTHAPATDGASSVCVHSVCVESAYRRRGVASALLREYVARLELANIAPPGTHAPYARVLLIAHEELRVLYERAGFAWVGESNVVHGPRPWFEMRRDLAGAAGAALAQDQPQAVPRGVWEALQRPSGGVPLRRTYATSGREDISDAVGMNGFDLLCPREGCGSLILKRGVAQFVEGPSVELEPPTHTPVHPLIAMPHPSEDVRWWLIKPSPMAFENIGFSRPVAPQVTAQGPRKKFLICAECDLGPLGWCFEGASEFWLACNRVGYRD